ncbi:MAG: FMN-binding protein [Pleomorphochaeta sp.]|jgi:electron transport complex protein RnfG
MKEYLKTSVVLALICAVAAIVLAILNGVTKPVITAYEQQKTLDALQAVSNGYEIGDNQITVDNNDSVNYYFELSNQGSAEGYLLNLNAVGYGGAISLVASYNLSGQVLEAKVVSNSETPGLGKKSEESWYMTKYENKDVIPTKKSQLSSDDAAAISGASITFAAIGKALSNGSDFVKSLGGN